ncbi:hypothetical protein CK203_074905 [Vitis vinifera]|uniref:Uncharacterized protein n=1 Tax=Vitis vinifera TaxID=29760 RepID=A0A438DED8_VITVI|nr:hypothetical protein CK203_074905 [Vitis vinifera]
MQLGLLEGVFGLQGPILAAFVKRIQVSSSSRCSWHHLPHFLGVSAPKTQENCIEQILVPPYSSSIIQEHKNRPPFSPAPSNPNPGADGYICVSDPKAEGEKSSRILESGCWAKGDYIKPDLSVSLNWVVRRTRQTASSGGMEETISCKRRRTDSPSLLPFFLKPSSGDRHHVQPEVLELRASSLEDLDLELRLGERPKVK